MHIHGLGNVFGIECWAVLCSTNIVLSTTSGELYVVCNYRYKLPCRLLVLHNCR